MVRWLAEDRVIGKQALERFEDIERGRKLGGPEGRALITQGNLMLFEYEQRVVVTPVFENYGSAMWASSELAMIEVPNREVAAACVARGRESRWSVALAGESYGPYVPRWGWLVETLEAVHGAVLARRIGDIGRSCGERARGRAENRTPATRAALRVAQSIVGEAR